jgi:hypothetical protein
MITIAKTHLAALLSALATAGCSSSSNQGFGVDSGTESDSGSQADTSMSSSGNDSGMQTMVDSGVPSMEASTQADSAVGTYDFMCGTGAACSKADVCCAMPGSGGSSLTYACVAPGSCPQMGDQVLCDGPDECGGGTPLCCGVEVPNGSGSWPSCGVTSVGTSCTSSCATHVGTNCTDTTTVTLCHDPSDCTDPANNQCCTFNSSGGAASLTFCIDGTTAAGAQATGQATCH